MIDWRLLACPTALASWDAGSTWDALSGGDGWEVQITDAEAGDFWNTDGWWPGPTIWHGGPVVGVWTPLDDGAIALDVFDDIGATARAAIDDEAERIREWLGDVRVKWRYPTARTKALRS